MAEIGKKRQAIRLVGKIFRSLLSSFETEQKRLTKKKNVAPTPKKKFGKL